jgi:hypothetical protein
VSDWQRVTLAGRHAYMYTHEIPLGVFTALVQRASRPPEQERWDYTVHFCRMENMGSKSDLLVDSRVRLQPLSFHEAKALAEERVRHYSVSPEVLRVLESNE